MDDRPALLINLLTYLF